MKRYMNYLVVLIIGLFLGWMFFGTNDKVDDHDHNMEDKISYWTCSMDPQVNLPEPGSCPICLSELIPV